MRRDRKAVRGSVAVETALILPGLILLIIGGWVLGYLVYVKVALALVANRAARDLAAETKLYSQLKQPWQPYRYDGGFAESFGLPRWGLHALAMKAPPLNKAMEKTSDFAVLVGVCYRVPFTIPFGVTERREPRAYLPDTTEVQELVIDVADLADLVAADSAGEALRKVEEEYREQKRLLEEETAAWDRLREEAEAVKGQGKEIWAKAEWAVRLVKQLFGREAPDLQKFGKRNETAQLEAITKTLCDPPEPLKGESIVLTSRAAYMMQEVFNPDKPGGLKPWQKQGGKK